MFSSKNEAGTETSEKKRLVRADLYADSRGQPTCEGRTYYARCCVTDTELYETNQGPVWLCFTHAKNIRIKILDRLTYHWNKLRSKGPNGEDEPLKFV